MSDDPETRDPVELVRETNDAGNRRDLDSVVRLMSPNVVYRPLANFTESTERRGREEYRRFAEEFLETWADDFCANLDTVRVYGDAVIARIVFTGHARASGVEISERMFTVYRVQNGLITRIEDFADREDALRAAGVSG
jgi:ketosteroid isomerase-like protein